MNDDINHLSFVYYNTDAIYGHMFNRFQENNGAVSQTQLSWLRRQLNECKKSNKKVFIAGHNPILRETSDTHQSWNSEDILEVIWSFSDTVLVHVNGHIHIG